MPRLAPATTHTRFNDTGNTSCWVPMTLTQLYEVTGTVAPTGRGCGWDRLIIMLTSASDQNAFKKLCRFAGLRVFSNKW